MGHLFKKIIAQISLENIKLFIFYIKEYGIKYTFQLSLMALVEKEIVPQFFYLYINNSTYQKWISKNEPSKKDLLKQKQCYCLLEKKSQISIVVATYNAHEYMLKEMIESVINQTYPNWELCIADGNSSKNNTSKILHYYARKEKKIKIKFLSENFGIAGNRNEAIAMAEGDYIAFLNHDDLLAPFALYSFVKYFARNKGLDLIYSDEDKISKNGRYRLDPFFKPDWGPSPDTLSSYNYFGGLAIIKRSFLNDKKVLFDKKFEGAHDYDLYLRIIERTNKIGHIPEILYHRRYYPVSAKFSDFEISKEDIFTGQNSLQQHMMRQGINCDVEIVHNSGLYRLKNQNIGTPLVSIIIPTKDNFDVLKKCVDSILVRSTYRNFEILIINNQSHESDTYQYFETLKEYNFIQVLDYKHEFNYSAINNWGASFVNGEILLFLNNDTEVITNNWIEEMFGCIQRNNVGAVGPKLFYTNDSIQNAGIVLGVSGLCGEAYKFFERKHSGANHGLLINRNVSAVTGACLMIKKHIFDCIKGFDENLKVEYNDVDLCLKVREREFLIVWTPFAELYHHERLTRGRPSTKEKFELEMKERRYFTQKWKDIIQNGDPYYNPNLNRNCVNFTL